MKSSASPLLVMFCFRGLASFHLPFLFMPCFRYTLALEHGDLINLHDWFQSFKTIISHPSTAKGKRKLKQPQLPKKTKETNQPENKSDASIQYPTGSSFYPRRYGFYFFIWIYDYG